MGGKVVCSWETYRVEVELVKEGAAAIIIMQAVLGRGQRAEQAHNRQDSRNSVHCWYLQKDW
jgi:hypothetical protein